MRYSKVLGVFISTLVISTAFISSNEIIAAPQKGDVVIESVENPDEGIFSEKEGLWQPNTTNTNDFLIRNNSKDTIKIKEFHLVNKLLINYVEDRIISEEDVEYGIFMRNSIITLMDNDRILYTGTFDETLNNGDIKLSDDIVIDGKEEKQLEMKIEIAKDMDNNGQNLKNEFSLGITYEEDKGINPPTTTPEHNKLPQTGQPLGEATKIAISVGMLLVGMLMLKKPRKKEVKD